MPPAGNWLEQILGIEEVTPARERMRALRVGEIMTRNPVCVAEDASVDDVITDMDLRNVTQVPVGGAGKVVGLISRFELIAALERRLSQSERTAEAAK
jgi:CBS domain-containing protein